MKTLSVILLFIMVSPDISAQSTDLRVGDAAPPFELIWATGDSISRTPISLEEIAAQGPFVLAFYPADWSSGCTREMCTLRDTFKDLLDLGIAVYGVSGDYPYSHREWAKHLNLPFRLLSDHTHVVSRSYQSFNESSGYSLRTVFLIDGSGLISYMDLNFGASNEESYNRLYEAVRRIK